MIASRLRARTGRLAAAARPTGHRGHDGDDRAGRRVAGHGKLAFGTETRALAMPIGDEPIKLGAARLPPIQLVGCRGQIVFLVAFSWFFVKSRIGVAMRAVADSQQVAMAMGINVRALFRAGLGDGRRGLGAGRHRMGSNARASTSSSPSSASKCFRW